MLYKQNIFLLLAFGLFTIFTISCKVSFLTYDAFKRDNNVEENDKGNYLLKNDGTKVYGQIIEWRSGTSNDYIKIDGQKFKPSEIMGCKDGNAYYGMLDNFYLKRIVHGHINVYVYKKYISQYNRVTSSTDMYDDITYYAQVGEKGKMIKLKKLEQIKALVKDCPLSVKMLDDVQMNVNKAIKKSKNYINRILETYNNDCQPVK